MANRICHLELLSKDLAAASKFFAGLFGWECSPWGGTYVMFKAGEGVGGGLTTELVEDARVVFYILVDDIDSKLREIEEAGGKTVHPKTLIDEKIGYYAIFADLDGNPIGLFSEK
jgi:hypothetical protein